MKLFHLISAAIILFILTIFPQDEKRIAQTWEGILKTGGPELRLVLHIAEGEDGKLAATLDSPNQGAKGIPGGDVQFANSVLNIVFPSIMGSFVGKVDEAFSKIEGEWKQGGQSFPLILSFADGDGEIEEVEFATWQGSIRTGAAELRLVFRFFKDKNDSTGVYLDSPDQGASGFRANNVIYEDDTVYAEFKTINGTFSGNFNDEKTIIDGEWKQAGQTFPLKLEMKTGDDKVAHPQEPKKPFPYNEEEVTFKNAEAGITLAGTYTYPKEGKNFPAVILISGSGPQNRDEELLGHKPFLVWSDYLTRNGIAVLRFDDRGIGKSTGHFNSATTNDFTSDVIFAIDYLKTREEVDKNNIGLIGHSEGGIVAPAAANRSSDVAFIILAAGTAVPGFEILLMQSKLISEKMGLSEEIIQNNYELYQKTYKIIVEAKDSLEMDKKLNELYEEEMAELSEEERSKPEYSKENMEQGKKILLTPWFRNFVKYDPRPELEKLKIPVLAFFGEKDLQVPPSQNESEMKKALEKSESENYEVVVLPDLNHLFQEAESGLPTDYMKIEQTTSPAALELMTDWIKEVTE